MLVAAVGERPRECGVGVGDLVAAVLRSSASSSRRVCRLRRVEPIGYLNTREIIDGRSVARIIPDPDRASLVALAFELYATGDYTLHQLADELDSRGLRSRSKTRQPLSLNGISSMLHNPAYIGKVTYQGVEHDGTHQPLLVPNHTSRDHPWFVRSRSSRQDPYRDYYIWRDPAPDGGPTNNWVSVFGGSAWTYDGTTGQYYLHLFASAQPDLNWDNPRVAAEFDRILRFWLDRGVAGFRIDVAHRLVKAPGLPDQPVVPPRAAAGLVGRPGRRLFRA